MDYAKLSIAALLASGLMLSGCGLIAAGAAGGVAGSELSEDDDEFDPLENTEIGQETEEVIDETVEE